DAAGLGALQRPLCRLNDLIGLTVAVVPCGDADAHGDRVALSWPLLGEDLLPLTLRADPAAQDELRVLHHLTHCFQLREALLGALAGEDDGELLAAVAISSAAAAHLGQLRGDHLEHLVPDVVPVTVVDALRS